MMGVSVHYTQPIRHCSAVAEYPWTMYNSTACSRRSTEKRVGSNFIGGTGNANLLMTKSTNISVLLYHHKRACIDKKNILASNVNVYYAAFCQSSLKTIRLTFFEFVAVGRFVLPYNPKNKTTLNISLPCV